MTAGTARPLIERSLAELVSENGRSAQVLEAFGLDFCCHGKRSLREAAQARGVDVAVVAEALSHLGLPAHDDVEPEAWQDLRVLVRHILDRHHAYVRSAAPAIGAWLNRLVERHGRRYPELTAVRETFAALAGELETQMTKEENIMFPYIVELAAARASGGPLPEGAFGTIVNLIRVMEADLDLAGRLAAQLREQSGGFTPPADGCTTFQLCYAELEGFERDLHLHIHLENNILFPRATMLEQQHV